MEFHLLCSLICKSDSPAVLALLRDESLELLGCQLCANSERASRQEKAAWFSATQPRKIRMDNSPVNPGVTDIWPWLATYSVEVQKGLRDLATAGHGQEGR